MPVIASEAKQSPEMDRLYCVYMLTNQHKNVLYTGVTSNLKSRVAQHREGLIPGSQNSTTSKYSFITRSWTTQPQRFHARNS